MPTPPELSIVIPVYNEEKILEREVLAVRSKMAEMLPQTRYEIVLVENGSTDATRSIARDLEQGHDDVRALSLETPSYGLALREGILQSRGTVVLLCNIDFWDIPFL